LATGHQPNVATAISVLQNLFPFDNFDATMMVMEAINTLQSKSTAYQVDVGTLEMITAAASSRGRHHICLKAWDILEAQGLRPTETIYENTITAFAMGFRQDGNCFAVLGEMEAQGYKPSRALIRSITRSLRFSVGRVDNAYHTLIYNEIEGAKVTVSSLNTILSGCAELGDPDRAFAMFQDFANFDLEPDEDTYSFMMESLSKATGPERPLDDAAVEGYLKAAESLLDMMVTKNVKVNRHTLHFYVHTLGNLGKMDAAKNAVLDAFEAGLGVENKTLSLIISACGDRGDLEMARWLCSKLSEPMDFIEKRMEQWDHKHHAKAATSSSFPADEFNQNPDGRRGFSGAV
jgi:pentatricopeptide repeat protein